MGADVRQAAQLAFSVDPDVTRARTLPSAFYLDPAVHAATRELVFARSWQWLGDLGDVAAPGTLSPREMLPGHLDEPLLLARDAAGELRCLSNVCTHRGNLLVRAPCRAEQIRCGYHSRRFDLAGRMTFMPGFEGAKDFPGPTDHLPRVPFAAFAGQAFASLFPAAPFDDFFADIPTRLAWLPFDAFRHDPSRDRAFEFAGHWALYVENYLEGLHIPFLHPALNQALDKVEREDEAAVESVQRGLRARLYRGGRYSPVHERGVHQFHRLLAEFLADA